MRKAVRAKGSKNPQDVSMSPPVLLGRWGLAFGCKTVPVSEGGGKSLDGYPKLPELRDTFKLNSFLFGKSHCKCSLNGGAVGGVMQNTLHIALKFSFAQRLAGSLGQRGRS